MTDERWVACPMNRDYEVSDMGNIRRAKAGASTRPGRLLRPHTDKKGYQVVTLSVSGKTKNMKVHRLVALAWIPNPDALETVNHIDGNKRNNQVGNLEWCSASENIEHAFRSGLKKFGENHDKALLSTSDVLDARRYLMAGESLSVVGSRLNVSKWAIHNIVRGLTWKRLPADPDWDRYISERREAGRKRRGISQ